MMTHVFCHPCRDGVQWGFIVFSRFGLSGGCADVCRARRGCVVVCFSDRCCVVMCYVCVKVSGSEM